MLTGDARDVRVATSPFFNDITPRSVPEVLFPGGTVTP